MFPSEKCQPHGNDVYVPQKSDPLGLPLPTNSSYHLLFLSVRFFFLLWNRLSSQPVSFWEKNLQRFQHSSCFIFFWASHFKVIGPPFYCFFLMLSNPFLMSAAFMPLLSSCTFCPQIHDMKTLPISSHPHFKSFATLSQSTKMTLQRSQLIFTEWS